MVQVTRLTAGSFIVLMAFIGVSGAAEQQFSCKGQVIQEMPKPTGQPPVRSISPSLPAATVKCRSK